MLTLVQFQSAILCKLCVQHNNARTHVVEAVKFCSFISFFFLLFFVFKNVFFTHTYTLKWTKRQAKEEKEEEEENWWWFGRRFGERVPNYYSRFVTLLLHGSRAYTSECLGIAKHVRLERENRMSPRLMIELNSPIRIPAFGSRCLSRFRHRAPDWVSTCAAHLQGFPPMQQLQRNARGIGCFHTKSSNQSSISDGLWTIQKSN